MIPYTPPVTDLRHTLEAVVGLETLQSLQGQADLSAELIDAVLEEAGKFTANVLAPLNYSGDKTASKLVGDAVTTPAGFKEAFRAYAEAGWIALPFAPEHGGQGLPWAVAFAVGEMVHAANMSFGLCPMLNQGGVDALTHHGSAELQRLFLPKLVSGEWAGTMNLTEPQAGSDLSAVRTRAERADGHYKITGQKIYITYGEHDFTENIIHLVLARLPDAPEGTKGISLFVVPKFLVNPDGTLGERNDLRCVSLEHKLGIKASPTAVMAFGDNGGAVGYLVGEEHRGIEYMFTMMNNARLSVGLQGVGLAERAYGQARDYAKTRIQGKPVGVKTDGKAIIHHPDVRRMLMSAKARIEAARALTLSAAGQLDIAARHPDATMRAQAQARVDVLTPVVKGWCTEIGCEIAAVGVQIHGGMGFIEETGAAQHYRDARIMTIYEGTNGIQAADLVFRKTLRDKGAAVQAFIHEGQSLVRELKLCPGDDMETIADALTMGLESLSQAVYFLCDNSSDNVRMAAASTPYLMVFGLVAGGLALARVALYAHAILSEGGDIDWANAKIITTRYYAEQVLPGIHGHLAALHANPAVLMGLEEGDL